MSRLVPLVAFTLIWSACGGGDATPDASATSDDSRADAVAVPRVHITQPQDGAAVPQGPLEVVFEVEGLVVSPAGTMDPGTGHHHLIVDADILSWTEPIGVEEGRYIHMGQAQTSFTVEGLEPGEHRLIAVVADGVHVPLDPPVADTVHITVTEGTQQE